VHDQLVLILRMQTHFSVHEDRGLESVFILVIRVEGVFAEVLKMDDFVEPILALELDSAQFSVVQTEHVPHFPWVQV